MFSPCIKCYLSFWSLLLAVFFQSFYGIAQLMANLFTPNVSKELTCPICWEIADDPVESSCCHRIFCQKCVLSLKDNNCGLCRQKANFTPSILARRITADMPCQCCYCDENITRGTKKDHEASCKTSNSKCPAANCNFKGKNEEFLFHLIESHDFAILKYAKRLFPGQQKTKDHLACCNICEPDKTRNINGIRYKCLVCPDFDLCESCEAERLHDEHLMVRIVNPEDQTWKKVFKCQE